MDPREPTDSPPGSPGKAEVLAERLRLGLPLFHPLDAGPRGRTTEGPEASAPATLRLDKHQMPLTPEEDAQIAAAYRAGHSVTAVANLVRRSTTAVKKSLRRQGIALRPRARPRLPRELQLRMVELYRAGHGIPAVAALTGCSPTGVRISLRRQGVACRPRGGRPGGGARGPGG
jgi:hypothetical protein